MLQRQTYFLLVDLVDSLNGHSTRNPVDHNPVLELLLVSDFGKVAGQGVSHDEDRLKWLDGREVEAMQEEIRDSGSLQNWELLKPKSCV